MKLKILLILLSIIILAGCFEKIPSIQDQQLEMKEAPARLEASCDDGYSQSFQEPFANWMEYKYYIDCKAVGCCCCYVKTHVLDFGQILENKNIDLKYAFAPRNKFDINNYTVNWFYSTDKKNWYLSGSRSIYSEGYDNHWIHMEDNSLINGRFKYIKIEVDSYGGYLDFVSANVTD